ncbi:helix-turn-helix domain-containing protein [Streptomyces poriferorum]|uniref:Helix-turn-helix domain-containing protein n=1 Tax=Streptomyces poriferorum TaxID=2798799 RepID=A0ABY9IFV3_9ACTN|nr:helix-turn-helix domain-containing protein [Streptomyces sp. Alt4]WLQ54082.1 helix-turn-helix domain-containing protein [Streptomyces sp. Alt2]
MVLLSAQGMPVARIAEVSFTSDDRVRDVIHNFNTDGFDSLYPKYSGGRPKTFTLPERREIKKIAKSKPPEHGLPFSTWSLTKLADFLVAEGVVDDISHEGLRILLREEGVSFQRLKTWKTSRDPDYAAEKARVEHLYAIADGEVIPEPGEPEVIFCMDEFGPLNRMPHPGRQWAERGGKHKDPDREPRRRRPGDLQSLRRGPVPVRCPGPDQGQAPRPHQAGQEADPVLGVLPVPPHASPTNGADRDRQRQLLPAPDHEEMPARRHLGSGEQCRDGLHPETAPGSTASRHSSQPCATSPSTAPTTPTTRNRAA